MCDSLLVECLSRAGHDRDKCSWCILLRGEHMPQVADFLHELVTQGRKGENSNFKSQKHTISHKKIQNLNGFKLQGEWMTIQCDLEKTWVSEMN